MSERLNLSRDGWRKSSRSNGQGGECTECKPLPGGMAVRDSKDQGGPVLRFELAAWQVFVGRVQAGELR